MWGVVLKGKCFANCMFEDPIPRSGYSGYALGKMPTRTAQKRPHFPQSVPTVMAITFRGLFFPFRFGQEFQGAEGSFEVFLGHSGVVL